MKKKLNGVIALLLSLACIPVIPLNANASSESERALDFAYHGYDDYVLETETFSYSREKLSLKGITGACFMVTGVFRVNGNANYTVLPVAKGLECRGWLDGSVSEIDGKELQVGDIIGSTEGSEWMVQEVIPPTYCPFNAPEYGRSCALTYIGNGVDLLGEEFKNVIRHELVVKWDIGYELTGDTGNVEITNGDATADGETGIVDVLAVNQSLLGIRTLSNYGVLASDVNHNDTVEDADAMKILKSLVGLETLE